MRIILSYQVVFLFVWLNFQLDKSELGERKREVIPTQRRSSCLGHSLIGACQIGMETGMFSSLHLRLCISQSKMAKNAG